MPIKPENRKRYPANWKQIRATILKRANHRCEGSPAYPSCRAPNGWYRIQRTGELVRKEQAIAHSYLGYAVTRIVLTIGHLDHTPENCDPSNLRAWCQRCHLNYDALHHAQTANETRRAGKAAGDLFDVAMAQRLGVVA
jgi:hypothetical protein